MDFKELLRREREKAFAAATPQTPTVGLAPKSPVSLEDAAVPGGVDGISYVPDWLGEEEAASLRSAIDEVSPSECDHPSIPPLCTPVI